MDSSYIVTFIGDDRPGLVEALSSVIGAAGGNWQESRLAQLSGKFAGLIRVSLPSDNAAGLETELKALADRGISVRVTPADTVTQNTAGAPPGTARRIKLDVIGPDRPGIVREVSRALAMRQFNVVAMDSAVESAPMSAEPLFHAIIEADIAPDATVEELAVALDEIGNDMALDIGLEEIAGGGATSPAA